MDTKNPDQGIETLNDELRMTHGEVPITTLAVA
jgi:hypothetical protein